MPISQKTKKLGEEKKKGRERITEKLKRYLQKHEVDFSRGAVHKRTFATDCYHFVKWITPGEGVRERVHLIVAHGDAEVVVWREESKQEAGDQRTIVFTKQHF